MSEPSGRSLVAVVLLVLAAGAALRVAWLTADPPTHATLGIVWHDEGAWVHNARNRALWNVWRTDEWNPVFIAPVFTALEYASFRTFGVGTWQARVVPVVSGLCAVAALMGGLAALAGRRAAIIGGCLLATNYVFVMWNRAALMESTMTAFIVAGWAAYAIAERRPATGFLAGVAVVLAWFTKAAAVFFVAAIGIDAAATLLLAGSAAARRVLGVERPSPLVARAALWTLAGLAAAAAVALGAFVLPYWHEYRFYNWQVAVTRKPEYALGALLDRASWLPVVHDYFTRMWLVTATAALGLTAIVVRWRSARPSERLLVLWITLGLIELVVHDSGNERRYVMFIPALIALTALVLGRLESLTPGPAETGPGQRWIAVPFLVVMAYLVAGSLVRLGFLFEVAPTVRAAAALAVVAGALLLWRWDAVWEWLTRQRITAAGAFALTGLAVGSDIAQYVQWARHRTSLNYGASVEIARTLPEGTLVHGKLASGLALENRIRPVFVGRGFGNYEDRKVRDDVRYILTYVAPWVGYEGRVITDVLDAYPNHRIIMTFHVAETTTGHDRAALIDKFGTAAPLPVTGRAQN